MITVRNKGIFCLLLAFCVFLMSSCNLSSPLPPDADAADGKGGTTEIIVPGGKTDKADEKQAAEKAKNDEKKNEKSSSTKTILPFASLPAAFAMSIILFVLPSPFSPARILTIAISPFK
jgi:hypothetical protein